MKKLFFVPLLILYGAFSFSHELQQKDYKFHSVFVYNFTKYIEWPSQSNQISIGVLNGGTSLIDSFNKMAEVKSSGTMSYRIVKVNNASQAQQCQILFIPEGSSDQLASYASALQGKPILLITESDGMIKKGSCINFVIVDGKLNIELNRAAVEKAGLKVSGQLLALAILV